MIASLGLQKINTPLRATNMIAHAFSLTGPLRLIYLLSEKAATNTLKN
jgi:hypothetical protein